MVGYDPSEIQAWTFPNDVDSYEPRNLSVEGIYTYKHISHTYIYTYIHVHTITGLYRILLTRTSPVISLLKVYIHISIYHIRTYIHKYMYTPSLDFIELC